MGLDLTVCPTPYVNEGGGYLLSTRIDLHRDYELFNQIKALPSLKGWLPVRWYEDDGLKERTTDPYGNDLKYTTASEFAAVDVPDDATDWNRAAIAFLAALPPETRVYLWWH